MRTDLLFIAGLVALAGCNGVIDLPSQSGAIVPVTDPNQDPEPTAEADPHIFKCADPTADPTVSTVSRLSRTQYINSLRDILGHGLSAPQADAFMAAVGTSLARLPRDGSGGKAVIYDTQDQGLNGLAATAQFETARALGTNLTNNGSVKDSFIRGIAGTTVCANTASSACVDAFIERFGMLALRRPLDPVDGDHEFYRSVYDTQKGYRGLIIALLLSPGFLFQTEFKGAAVAGRSDLSTRTPYELASKLSFSIVNTMPDDALFAAAAANFTGPGNSLAEQTDRLVASAEARAQYRSFFTQWLRPDRVPGLSNTILKPALTMIYPDNADAGLSPYTDLVKLRSAAIQEVVDLGDYYAFGVEHGTLKDVMTSDLSFSQSDDLSRLYGVDNWTPADGGTPTHFAPGQRAGLFTRAAFLFSGATEPNPIMRGARLRTEFLCASLTPPGNINVPSQVVLPTEATHRHELELKTQTNGTVCAGCHVTMINPLGFAFDSYDSLGRYRSQQPILELATGKTKGWAPIDAATMPRVDSLEDTTQTTDAVGLSAQLGKSEQLSACFTRHYFRFTAGRPENEKTDGCQLRQMNDALSDPATGSLQGLIRSVPTTRAFTVRKIVPET